MPEYAGISLPCCVGAAVLSHTLIGPSVSHVQASCVLVHVFVCTNSSAFLQAFQELAKALMGPKFSFTPPWPIADPHALQQHIQAANFGNATCAEYSHNFQFPIDELVKLLVGPHSQFKPMLNKLQAAGNSNIYQQAAQVKIALQPIESLLCVVLICPFAELTPPCSLVWLSAHCTMHVNSVLPVMTICSGSSIGNMLIACEC